VTHFEGIPRGTMADRVYSEVRAAILSGTMAGGSELNQVGLARQFEVSRVPVREALRRLQAEQLVSVTPYQQYVVAPLDRGKTLLELIEIRAELEVLAVRRRVGLCTADELQELRDHNARLRKETDATQWFHGDIDFHHLLNGRSSAAAALVRVVRERVHRSLQTVASTSSRRLEACVEHDAILRALDAGDAEAAETCIRNHIAHTRTVIVSHLEHSAEESTVQAI
jgi:DNA-binding GntR family transcriptional regulator